MSVPEISWLLSNLGVTFLSQGYGYQKTVAPRKTIFSYILEYILQFCAKYKINFFPIVAYGKVCKYDLNAKLLNKLDRLLNNRIRFVLTRRRYDDVSVWRRLRVHVVDLQYSCRFSTFLPKVRITFIYANFMEPLHSICVVNLGKSR